MINRVLEKLKAILECSACRGGLLGKTCKVLKTLQVYTGSSSRQRKIDGKILIVLHIEMRQLQHY